MLEVDAAEGVQLHREGMLGHGGEWVAAPVRDLDLQRVQRALCNVQAEAVAGVGPLHDGVGRDGAIHGDDRHQVGAAHELRVDVGQIVSQAWADACHADAEVVVSHGVEDRLACEDARRGCLEAIGLCGGLAGECQHQDLARGGGKGELVSDAGPGAPEAVVVHGTGVEGKVCRGDGLGESLEGVVSR